MRIGEVAQHSGISARMLRHYDRIGLVSPTERTPGGYREYSEDDVRRLFHVEGLRSLGLSLAQIAEVIEDRAFDPAAMVDRLIERTQDQIAQAQDLVRRLERVHAADPKTWDDVLRTVGLIRGFGDATPSHRQRLALTMVDGDRRDVPVLIDALLRETSEDVAGALQWAIARIGDAAVPALAGALQSNESGRRRRALDTLVKLGTPAAHRAIMGSVEHQDRRIRNRAIITRARHGRKDSIAALVELIVIGQDDVEASDVLAEFATRHGLTDQAVAAMAGALGTADAAARRRLVAALGALPVEPAMSTLVSVLDDDDRATALTARLVLGVSDTGAEA